MFHSMSHLEQHLYFTLGEREQRVFTIHDITSILNISEQHARNLAANMTKKQVAERVKAGLFVRIPESVILDKKQYKEDAVLIAAKALHNAFLSHYTALSIHGLAERYSTRIYVTTPCHQRPMKYHDIHIQFITVVPRRFFGMKTMEYSHQKISVADQERTILEIINKPAYAGGWSELISCLKNLEHINWATLLTYIKKFNNKILARRIGYLMDNLKNVSLPPDIKNKIQHYSGNNVYYFDATKKGVLEDTWNIIVPKRVHEALHGH